MSIKLHGMPLSNYYNVIKVVLLEKGIGFEEVSQKPSQEEEYLKKSPMGKVPCLETAEGFLTETSVMLEYLDELAQGPSLYPSDPFLRAKIREIIRYTELYIELPARRLYGEVFFNGSATDEVKAEVKSNLEKGFRALLRIAKFDPYLAGHQISYADFYALFALSPVTIVCKKTWNWDVRNEIPKMKTLIELLGERDSVQKVQADQGSDS
ncbi:MAG: glutathione S-transferase [Gammaproteobacteria bacterium]|nr:glutathione S-transferase [Gammaproteobacteria bacterium]